MLENHLLLLMNALAGRIDIIDTTLTSQNSAAPYHKLS